MTKKDDEKAQLYALAALRRVNKHYENCKYALERATEAKELAEKQYASGEVVTCAEAPTWQQLQKY